MKCDSGNLQLYVWNELNDNLRQKTEEHLKKCGNCRKELAELENIYGQVMASTPSFEESDSEKIWSGLQAEQQGNRKKLIVFSPGMLLKAAVILLVFAAGMFVGNSGRKEILPLPVDRPELMSRLGNYFNDVQPLVVNLANDVELDDEERATGLIIELLNKNRDLQKVMNSKKDPYINDLLCEIEIILMDLGKIADKSRCSIKKKNVDYEDVAMKLNMFSIDL